MDKEESLSEDGEQVQTSKRSRRPSKAIVKANKKTFKTGQPKQSNGSDMHEYHRILSPLLNANGNH